MKSFPLSENSGDNDSNKDLSIEISNLKKKKEKLFNV